MSCEVIHSSSGGGSEDNVAPFLSVRTAFDLYLKALKLPRGSRVVCSALTIPDMVSVFEEHGLVPLPVDLNPHTLAPEPGALESAVERHKVETDDASVSDDSGRVRAIYVAHVFGAQVRGLWFEQLQVYGVRYKRHRLVHSKHYIQ